jgi:hypothetical protein
VTFDEVRLLALSLPETSEKPCYGTPAFYVRKKIFTRMLEREGFIVVKVDLAERGALLATAPEAFSVTDHYRNYPMVIVNLAIVDRAELWELLVEGWRMSAPRTLAQSLGDSPPEPRLGGGEPACTAPSGYFSANWLTRLLALRRIGRLLALHRHRAPTSRRKGTRCDVSYR